jgi:hypothetical protein
MSQPKGWLLSRSSSFFNIVAGALVGGSAERLMYLLGDETTVSWGSLISTALFGAAGVFLARVGHDIETIDRVVRGRADKADKKSRIEDIQRDEEAELGGSVLLNFGAACVSFGLGCVLLVASRFHLC